MSDCSTHAFDVPLKSCPFCGGEAKTRLNDRWWIHCSNCTCEIGFEGMDENGYYGHFATEAEAVAAWNSRAELRSEPVSMRTFDSMETALSIAEKEVEIEELRRENYELCKENEELAHRRAELESIAHGTLTAEQVREATYAHSIHADCADADWQAIADELNSRAERTCRPIEVPHGIHDDTTAIVCSACRVADDDLEDYNYCPNCGARVKK